MTRSWTKDIQIVIIDEKCRPEIADYVTPLTKHCYISYQWYPMLSNTYQRAAGIPLPAIHIYEDEQARLQFDKERKIDVVYGVEAALLTLKDIATKFEICLCDAFVLFNKGCQCSFKLEASSKNKTPHMHGDPGSSPGASIRVGEK